MGKLDSLKITEAPSAFADMALKVNRVVDLIAAIEGKGGVDVTIAENNIIIEGGAAGDGGDNEVSVLSSDGTLVKVAKTDDDGGYPSVLKVVDSGVTIQMQGGELQVFSTGGHHVRLTENSVEVVDNSGGGISLVQGEGVHVFNASGKDCFIDYTALTHNMGIATVAVCDSGTPKSMDIIASSPY